MPAALAGERIDRVVSFVTGCTRSEAAKLIAGDGVRRNRRRVRKGAERVAEGDVVAIDDAGLGAKPLPQPEPGVSVDVIHEDEQVVVVNKPAGLVVHPGAGTAEHTLVNGLLARFPELSGVGEPERPGIVHRLDKGPSGRLMVARTEPARAALVEQLASRSVERMYVALVWGHLESDHGVVDAPIGRDPRRPTRMTVRADGRDARTGYEVVRRLTSPVEASMLHCRLETGRTHQIRVHMAAIGHPIVGDDVYGGRRESLPFPRPALHASVLGFDHPDTGERVRFETAPPTDLQDLLDTLS